jgi:protein-S-isoprenylcysteine O-methyltransferase Ste14
MTPEQEARNALDFGTARSDLSTEAQPVYDRLAEERARGVPERQPRADHATAPKWAATLITVLSFPMGPGIVVVLLPYLITRWQPSQPPWPLAVRALGVALIAAGGLVMVATFARFPREGTGTPFPTNPPSSRKVIVGGPYRYVRNPMYVSFLVANIGQALLLSSIALLIYAPVLLVALMLFVRGYEERTLAKRFGPEYEAYRSQVPGWWPRFRRRAPSSASSNGSA